MRDYIVPLLMIVMALAGAILSERGGDSSSGGGGTVSNPVKQTILSAQQAILIKEADVFDALANAILAGETRNDPTREPSAWVADYLNERLPEARKPSDEYAEAQAKAWPARSVDWDDQKAAEFAKSVAEVKRSLAK